MKITVLDGYALNPGDLSWDEIAGMGELTVYDRTAPGETVERAAGSEIVFTNKTILDEETLDQLPGLKYVGVLATGYNVVDIAAARKRGIAVTNIPAYSTMSVAQMVFALLLAMTNRVEHYSSEVKKGRWSDNPDFCFWDTPLVELAGKRMGIVGFGNIGRAVARIAVAFGMEVSAFTSKPQSELPEGVVKAELDTLFADSDVVSLHCPLTESTKHMINSRTLSLMKPSGMLINTGRGPLVNESDLYSALKNGVIAAAGADVLTSEPPEQDNPLFSLPNFYVTPHIAWATEEARRRLMSVAAGNLRAFLTGNPVNNVVQCD